MTSDPDAPDEALSWAGDEIDAQPQPGRAQRGRDAAVSAPDGVAAPGGSALLVFYGILSGVYLLYMVGWLISIVRYPYSLDNMFAEIVYQFGEFLAIASPLVWFFAVVTLTRGKRPSLRVAWLIAGAILLVPWPFVLGVN